MTFTYPVQGDAEVTLSSEVAGDEEQSSQERLTKALSKKPATTKQDLVKQVTQMIRNLVALSQTLDALPESRWLTMKLYYYDDVTPKNYGNNSFEIL